MDTPKVSILIANYNYAHYIEEAIASALNQTHENIEVIIVDDGSTDNSVEVINRHDVKLVAQKNLGVCAARNNAVAISSGEFIVFLDADDILSSDYVEKCLAVLQSSTSMVAYTYTQMEYFGNKTGLYKSQPFSSKALAHGNYINVSALMRKAVFESVGGFDRSFAQGLEDYELFVRFYVNGYDGVFLEEPLLKYRQHTASRNDMSRQIIQNVKARLWSKYPLFFWRKYHRHPYRILKWSLTGADRKMKSKLGPVASSELET